jgi:3-oxoacyl-[acyl-carrier protein] reductase
MNKKIILITGASRGIGAATATVLANDYDLILQASKEENLQKLLAKIPNVNSHHVLCADLTDSDSVNNFVKTLKKDYANALYGVINNAGITSDKSILFQPEKEIDLLMQVNLKAPIMIGKAALKIFSKKNQGILINISSLVGEKGNAFQSVYAATKGALVSLSKSWAQEMGELNSENMVRVLSVSPGFIESAMTQKIPDDIIENYKSKIPLKRAGKADEVASLIKYLVSEESSYINGTDIKINGGLS